MPANKITWVLSLAGALLIGALGNGVWELVRPLFVGAGSLLLDLSTFGYSQLIDAIYVEVARGTYERVALSGFGVLAGVVFYLAIVAPVAFAIVPRYRALTSRIARLPAELSSKLSDDLQRTNKRMLRAMALLLVVTAVFIGVQHARLVYVVRAANHMEQLQRVIAPYLTSDERLSFSSRFSAMRSRAEYVALTTEIAVLARRNKLVLPEFDIY